MTRRLLALALACAVLVGMLYVFFVRTEVGQRVDDAALDGRSDLTAEEVQDADELLATVSVGSIVLLGGAIVVVAVVRGRIRLAVGAAAVVAGANVGTQLVKAALSRPSLVADELDIGNSLPSGHTTVAMSLAVAALLVASRRTRGAVAMVGVLYAAGVGVATLTAGWHRPSDAVAAFAVVVGWGAAVAAWIGPEVAGRSRPIGPQRSAEEEDGEQRESAVATPVLVSAGALLCGFAFTVLVAVLAARRLGRLDTIDLGRAYTTGVVAIAGSALLLTGALLFALRAEPRPAPAAVP